jgi:hypothetical protein
LRGIAIWRRKPGRPAEEEYHRAAATWQKEFVGAAPKKPTGFIASGEVNDDIRSAKQ